MKFLFVQTILTLFIVFSLLFLFVNMTFLVQGLFILFAIVMLLILLSMVWPPDSPWSPWWKTNKDVAKAVAKLAKLKSTDIVYELGSGDGEALLTLAKYFQVRCVGVEIDPFRHYQSRLRAWKNQLSQKITFLKKNFFDVSLSEATVVYVYLVPKALMRLESKFLKELRPGTRVVSYRYQIPYLREVAKDTKHELFLYAIPQKQSRSKKSH